MIISILTLGCKEEPFSALTDIVSFCLLNFTIRSNYINNSLEV